MKNKNTAAAVVIAAAAVILLSSIAAVVISRRKPAGSTVEIISDGKVICTLDLSFEPDREITVEYKGRKNIIAIENGDIYMKEAECPDHTCMKTGRLSEAGVPIVCLPNHLIIRYKNGGGDTDAAA